MRLLWEYIGVFLLGSFLFLEWKGGSIHRGARWISSQIRPLDTAKDGDIVFLEDVPLSYGYFHYKALNISLNTGLFVTNTQNYNQNSFKIVPWGKVRFYKGWDGITSKDSEKTHGAFANERIPWETFYQNVLINPNILEQAVDLVDYVPNDDTPLHTPYGHFGYIDKGYFIEIRNSSNFQKLRRLAELYTLFGCSFTLFDGRLDVYEVNQLRIRIQTFNPPRASIIGVYHNQSIHREQVNDFYIGSIKGGKHLPTELIELGNQVLSFWIPFVRLVYGLYLHIYITYNFEDKIFCVWSHVFCAAVVFACKSLLWRENKLLINSSQLFLLVIAPLYFIFGFPRRKNN